MFPISNSPINNSTGSWRSQRPRVTASCIGCGICADFCPDGCIELVDGKAKIDYTFCKGCLICKNECPVKAIESEVEQ